MMFKHTWYLFTDFKNEFNHYILSTWLFMDIIIISIYLIVYLQYIIIYNGENKFGKNVFSSAGLGLDFHNLKYNSICSNKIV